MVELAVSPWSELCASFLVRQNVHAWSRKIDTAEVGEFMAECSDLSFINFRFPTCRQVLANALIISCMTVSSLKSVIETLQENEGTEKSNESPEQERAAESR